ncbi:unnamed protein product [Peniophora sp. CBMAI 1063]|nr:unnamed protein product [Peniophora sp. CBMAI 1063]
MSLVELPSRHTVSLIVQPAAEPNDLPPVLFVHGLANNRDVFASLLASLPTRKRIAYDLPGHGKSPLYTPFNLATLVSDCQAILAHAGVDGEIDIVAHSGGTVIALALAAELKSRVRALILLGAPALPMPDLVSPAAALRAGGTSALLAAQINALGADGRRDERVRSELEKMVLAQSTDGPCAVLESFSGFALPQEIQARKSIVIYGDEDTFARPEDAEKLASLLGGEAFRIPTCGHAMLLEKPEAVQEIIHRALSA